VPPVAYAAGQQHLRRRRCAHAGRGGGYYTAHVLGYATPPGAPLACSAPGPPAGPPPGSPAAPRRGGRRHCRRTPGRPGGGTAPARGVRRRSGHLPGGAAGDRACGELRFREEEYSTGKSSPVRALASKLVGQGLRGMSLPPVAPGLGGRVFPLRPGPPQLRSGLAGPGTQLDLFRQKKKSLPSIVIALSGAGGRAEPREPVAERRRRAVTAQRRTEVAGLSPAVPWSYPGGSKEAPSVVFTIVRNHFGSSLVRATPAHLFFLSRVGGLRQGGVPRHVRMPVSVRAMQRHAFVLEVVAYGTAIRVWAKGPTASASLTSLQAGRSHPVGRGHLQRCHKASSASRPYASYARCGAKPSRRMRTLQCCHQRVEKGAAAPAGYISYERCGGQPLGRMSPPAVRPSA